MAFTLVQLAVGAVAAAALAGIGPDLFTNGAILLFPIYDQFIALSGRVWLTDEGGFVQMIREVEPSTRAATRTVLYATGVDPVRGADPANVERVFPLADSGFQLLLVLGAVVVSTTRLRLARKV